MSSFDRDELPSSFPCGVVHFWRRTSVCGEQCLDTTLNNLFAKAFEKRIRDSPLRKFTDAKTKSPPFRNSREIKTRPIYRLGPRILTQWKKRQNDHWTRPYASHSSFYIRVRTITCPATEPTIIIIHDLRVDEKITNEMLKEKASWQGLDRNSPSKPINAEYYTPQNGISSQRV